MEKKSECQLPLLMLGVELAEADPRHDGVHIEDPGHESHGLPATGAGKDGVAERAPPQENMLSAQDAAWHHIGIPFKQGARICSKYEEVGVEQTVAAALVRKRRVDPSFG